MTYGDFQWKNYADVIVFTNCEVPTIHKIVKCLQSMSSHPITANVCKNYIYYVTKNNKACSTVLTSWSDTICQIFRYCFHFRDNLFDKIKLLIGHIFMLSIGHIFRDNLFDQILYVTSLFTTGEYLQVWENWLRKLKNVRIRLDLLWILVWFDFIVFACAVHVGILYILGLYYDILILKYW